MLEGLNEGTRGVAKGFSLVSASIPQHVESCVQVAHARANVAPSQWELVQGDS